MTQRAVDEKPGEARTQRSLQIHRRDSFALRQLAGEVPSVYATPEVHALVGTGLSKTLCWYAARLSAGMFRRISHQVQPVRMSASTSTTWNTVPKDTEPTTRTLNSALSSMRCSSTKRRSLAWITKSGGARVVSSGRERERGRVRRDAKTSSDEINEK